MRFKLIESNNNGTFSYVAISYKDDSHTRDEVRAVSSKQAFVLAKQKHPNCAIRDIQVVKKPKEKEQPKNKKDNKYTILKNENNGMVYIYFGKKCIDTFPDEQSAIEAGYSIGDDN